MTKVSIIRHMCQSTLSAFAGCVVIVIAADLSQLMVANGLFATSSNVSANKVIDVIFLVGGAVGGACGGAIERARSMAGAWIAATLLTLLTCFGMLMEASEGGSSNDVVRALVDGVVLTLVFLLSYWIVQHLRAAAHGRRSTSAI